MKKLIILIIISTIAFAACSTDNPLKQDDSKSDFPNPALGTKVIFDLYTLSFFDDKLIEEESGQGFYYKIEEIKDFAGRKAHFCNFYNPLNQKYNVEIFSYNKEEKAIYIYSNYIDSMASYITEAMQVDSLPLSIKDSWVKVADYNKNQWDVYQKDFKNYKLVNGTIDGTTKISCAKGADTVIILNKVNYPCKSFTITAEITGKFTSSSVVGPKDDPISIKFRNTIYFNEKIGKINNTTYPIDIKTIYFSGLLRGIKMNTQKVEF